MAAKTATSILLEFCTQEKVAPPQYESVIHDSDPSVFVVLVKAFDIIEKGSGRTKKDAKHAASQKIIDVLSCMERYKMKLNIGNIALPPPPPPTNDNYYGTLLTLCMKHNLQSPVFNEVSVTGAGTHKPEFTYCLKLGSYDTYGIATTKKEAKRIASEEMLKLLESLLEGCDVSSCDVSSCGSSSIGSNEVVPNALPLLELPSVEEILAEYRRLRKPYLKPAVEGLRYRKNFFINLPAADRRKAQKVLNNRAGGFTYRSAKDLVDQTCHVLKIEYKVEPMSTPPNFLRFFFVDSKYDCVFIEHRDKLFNHIIEYFKTMLNMQTADLNQQQRIKEDNNNY